MCIFLTVYKSINKKWDRTIFEIGLRVQPSVTWHFMDFNYVLYKGGRIRGIGLYGRVKNKFVTDFDNKDSSVKV